MSLESLGCLILAWASPPELGENTLAEVPIRPLGNRSVANLRPTKHLSAVAITPARLGDEAASPGRRGD